MTSCDYQTILVHHDASGVVSLVLNRPEKKNALSAKMIEELSDAAHRLGLDPDARVVVLSGVGDVFCAGGDLGWMKAQIAAGREDRMREARKLATMLSALNRMPKPLIGKVQGGAFGGGLGLMCVCDYVVASSAAKFGLTETRLGLIPATIGPYVITRLGEGMARRVFMSARVFDASEALAIGLASEVADPDALDARVDRQVRPYLAVAPGAVGAAKALALSLGPRIDEQVVNDTVARLADVWETDEAAEGVAAFFERRDASWVRRRPD